MKRILILFLFVFTFFTCDLFLCETTEKESKIMGTIDLVTAPTGGAPLTTNDYDAQNNYIQAAINRLLADQLHLTNWSNLSVPAVSQYVYIQHGGALFQVNNSNATISGSPSNGRVYVKLTRSGDVLTASFVNSASGYSWNYVYCGFYHSDGTQLLPYVLYKNGSNYYKFTLKDSENKFDISANLLIKKIINIPGWDMDADASKSIDLSDNNILFAWIMSIEAWIINDSQDDIRSIDVSFIVAGDQQPSGSVRATTTTDAVIVARHAGGWYDSLGYNDSGIVPRGYVLFFLKI